MSLLHQAVLEEDLEKLATPAFVEKWQSAVDDLGFTALEIAKFLGKDKAARLLGGSFPACFGLQAKGMRHPLNFSCEAFEKAMGINYRPFLRFPSYEALRGVVNNCPYILRSRSLASDNYQWTETYKRELADGTTAALHIKWIDDLVGYGAFAVKDIPAGSFVGEYTGIVRRLYRRHADQNPYCFHYPTKFWSFNYYVVDSMHEGNLTRFINHARNPNLHPLCLVDRGLLHLVLVASRAVKAGEQLTFDYGDDYWSRRKPLGLPGRI